MHAERPRLLAAPKGSFFVFAPRGSGKSTWIRDAFPQGIGLTRRELEAYAVDQLDWTFGLNPFDACMQRGQGRNTPDYSPDWPSAPGGVCSGITSGFDDEHDIALLPPPHDQDPAENWRWSEQWLPHGAWLVLALAAQQAALGE